MGGSYKQCSECGKRALSIATRCPACGAELHGPVLQDETSGPDPRRFLIPLGALAVLVLVAGLTVALLSRGGQEQEEESEVASSLPSTSPLNTSRAAGTPAEGSGEVLVARTWTNVRSGRSVKAPLEAMLLPGDTVEADSLERGWYRVALEGEVLGYVHRSTLVEPDTSP